MSFLVRNNYTNEHYYMYKHPVFSFVFKYYLYSYAFSSLTVLPQCTNRAYERKLIGRLWFNTLPVEITFDIQHAALTLNEHVMKNISLISDFIPIVLSLRDHSYVLLSVFPVNSLLKYIQCGP
jgi:hypothetical protein